MNIRKLFAAMLVVASGFVSFGAQAASPLIAARQKFFGIENVDPNTGAIAKNLAVFSWLSNTTLLAALNGRVVMLDAYVTRLEVTPGRVPFVIQDVLDAKPEAILLGHGHGDHADNAAYIAKWTGATIYSTPETCDVMQQDVVRMFADPNKVNGGVHIIPDGNPVNCVNVVSRGSVPGMEVTHLTFLEPLVCIVGFKHMHSNATPPDPIYPAAVFNVTVDPRDPQMYPHGTSLTPPAAPAAPVVGQMDTTTTGFGGTAGPISLFYDFVVRGPYNFTFVWHDTTGALKEGIAPDGNWGPTVGQNVFNLLAALPNTDLEFGSASSSNTVNNGERDLVLYQQSLKPQIYIPGHMTTGTNGVSESSTQEMWFMYRSAQTNMSTVQPIYKPETHWLVDPVDYTRPLIFNTGVPRWSNPAKAARISQFCS